MLPLVQDPQTIVIRSPRSRSAVWRGLVDFDKEHLLALKHTLRILAPEALHDVPTVYPDEVLPVLAALEENTGRNKAW